MTDEQWATIDGFPDYAVSNLGRVMSLRYNALLAPRPNSYGHHRVVLYREKVGHDLYIHHLVAAAFTTGYRPGMQVRHRDMDKGNNEVTNLRFPGSVGTSGSPQGSSCANRGDGHDIPNGRGLRGVSRW